MWQQNIVNYGNRKGFKVDSAWFPAQISATVRHTCHFAKFSNLDLNLIFPGTNRRHCRTLRNKKSFCVRLSTALGYVTQTRLSRYLHSWLPGETKIN